MKKTLTTLIVLSIILFATKKNDAIKGTTTTTSSLPQVAQGDSLFQGKCLLSNGYLISPGGAYKLYLSPNGNLIQQVIFFYFIQNII